MTQEVFALRIDKTLLTHDIRLRDVYQKLKPRLLPPPDKRKGAVSDSTLKKNNYSSRMTDTISVSFIFEKRD